jgi:hypothetical protein
MIQKQIFERKSINQKKTGPCDLSTSTGNRRISYDTLFKRTLVSWLPTQLCSHAAWVEILGLSLVTWERLEALLTSQCLFPIITCLMMVACEDLRTVLNRRHHGNMEACSLSYKTGCL